MMKLKLWQWLILGSPLVLIVSFILFAASSSIHRWGINWIWILLIFIMLAWRWLLVYWTKPARLELESIVNEVQSQLESSQLTIEESVSSTSSQTLQAQNVLQKALEQTASDPPLWQDPASFWLRCQQLITEIAHIYHPEVKYPLLNIYVPQAYGLLRDTVDDLDRVMAQLGPVLNQVTVGQAYQAYEVYQKLSPSARKLWQVWNWAQWLLNPGAALAKQVTQKSSNQATQELLVNFSQILRQAALYNLCQKAIALYGGENLPAEFFQKLQNLSPAKTETLAGIIEKGKTVEKLEQQDLRILLIGRTGAGKSSLINTLFKADLAAVDVLPSTDKIKTYQWQSSWGDKLELWDSPGYEQVKGEKLRTLVLDYGRQADLLLLVNPVLDPALQMDRDFLQDLRQGRNLPTIMIVTQVDRLRPVREWQPPYNWLEGNQPKEISIREAINYRREVLGDLCPVIIPVVNQDLASGRQSWGTEPLSLAILEAIDPAKEARLAKFFSDRTTQVLACGRIIERYSFQMSSGKGLTALLKSPILTFLATLTTGSPELGYLLAQQIPIEQLPLVIGKLQMAYELWQILGSPKRSDLSVELLSLWPSLLDNTAEAGAEAWAFGYALVEYWTQDLSPEQLQQRVKDYLKLKTP